MLEKPDLKVLDVRTQVFLENLLRNQTLKERAINSAKRMLADGILTLEKIAEYAGLPLDEVKKLKVERMK